MKHQRQQGVALVITLILLSVITLTAITFLILSRREKGAVATSTDQTISRLAADTGLERAQAEILSTIIATTNEFGYQFKVTTNYVNPYGFQSGNTLLTNVSYTYPNGTPLNAADQEQNIANLFYNPRVPVYVDTNGTAQVRRGPLDFRYYLDLNRNRRYETNGLIIEMDSAGQPILSASGSFVSNNVVGDPEWIGILERPDEPHGPDNRFVARYATVMVPSGKTLDLNKIHNQAAALRDPGTGYPYRRNMGVGTWEMNLAAFLVDLNTNLWSYDSRVPPPSAGYNYFPLNGVPQADGFAFEDANSLISYRYQRDYRSLTNIPGLFGGRGVTAFENDLIDGYGAGPYQTGVVVTASDPDSGRTGDNWPGDDNPQQYFSPGDLFDINKTAIGARRTDINTGNTFPGRLYNAGLGNSTYDRYTFYRLLSQLGTDSGPERDDRVNLNYDNKVYRNAQGIASATNFVEWRAVDFFLQAADQMFREYHNGYFQRALGQDFVRDRNNNLAVNIPVVTNGVFVYTPSINRVLQLAANMYDARTNNSDGTTIDYPTVFRPTFDRTPPDDVYITGWQVLDSQAMVDAALSQPLKDPFDALAANGRRTIAKFDNVYGVPWIVGAKKGLPNFNELSVETIFEVTRKLELRRPALRSRPTQTNQMFLISINSDVGVEAWNSYRDDFTQPVTVYATNQLDVMVYMTNRPSGTWTVNGWRNQPVGRRPPAVLSWPGTKWGGIPDGDPNPQSFLTVIRTNFNVITNSIFRADGGLETRLSPAYQGSIPNQFPVPDVSVAFTNRLQFVMIDNATRRVLDYVQLRLGGRTNLTEILTRTTRRDDLDDEAARLWNTNRSGGNSISVPTDGILRQILVSGGFAGASGVNWRNYGFGQAAGNTRLKAQERFRQFLSGQGTNLVMQAPFTPSRRISQYMSWQANDPLVHYLDGDLQQLALGTGVQELPLNVVPQTLENIGQLNDRYEPWGGNPRSSAQTGTAGERNYDLRFKDPLVRSSDSWQFPTNKFPNVGWLGRVHRGTPWQTIYMKAPEIPRSRSRQGGAGRDWREWTGNANRRDAERTFPQEDWRLFDLFTAAFNENATAGQLSVNQDGLAAWSAVLSGVIALTNTTPDESWENYSFSVVITNDPVVIPPAGVAGTNSPLGQIVAGINSDRRRAKNRAYQSVGDILQAEELTVRSPFLNRSETQAKLGITDAMYERIPQQIMGLLRGKDQPRYVIYSYGQALKPAPRSLVTSGTFFGMCTNYQIVAESATRAVVRVDGAPENPRVVLESFNVLPPD